MASSRPTGAADVVRDLGRRAFAWKAVPRALASTPRARGRSLVLLWHRVRPHGELPHEVLPAVSADLFARQLEALADVGDFVSLAEAERPSTSSRPRFAITFDDDHVAHVAHALPVLRQAGVPATFFLSGRWNHDLGPYWWEVLEARIARDGLDATARSVGITASSAAQLAGAVEGTPLTMELSREDLGEVDRMPATDAVTLRDAGMEVGFHTLHHPVMTLLDDAGVEAALRDGRTQLEATIGRPMERFAYPHGRIDRRVAALTQAADWGSAWTTHTHPVDPAVPAAERGRWEPGPREPDELLRGVLRRLHLPRATASSAPWAEARA